MGPLGLVCVCTSRTRGQGMSIYRHKLWTDVAALDDHLTVFLKLDEALENFLGDFGFSSPEPYKISTGGGAVDRPFRAQISAAVDTLGGSLHSLEARYNDTDRSRTVSLHTQPFPAYPLERIACSLDVHGDDEQETNGRFDTLRNRMDAEIKRQFPPSTPVKQATAPPVAAPPAATGPSATAPSSRGFKQWLDGVSRHPIIVGLVLLGASAMITVLSKVLGG